MVTIGNQEAALELPGDVPVRTWRRRSEAAVIRGVKRGDPDAIAELFRRHWDAAHRTAFLMLQDAAGAEDVVQEAMLAVIRGVDGFDRRRPFRPWFHRIVVNRALDWLRARSRRAEVHGELLDSSPASAEEELLSEPLVAALAHLDPDQRAAVLMRHLLGYSPSEISRLLGVPVGTVRSRLSRGLTGLRQTLEETNG